MNKDQIIKAIKESPDFKGMHLSNILAVITKLMVMEGMDTQNYASFLRSLIPGTANLLRLTLNQIIEEEGKGASNEK